MNSHSLDSIIKLRAEGFSNRHIAKKLNYSISEIKKVIIDYEESINIYLDNYEEEKYELNKEFFNLIKPKTILDLYCGKNRFWASNYGSICNVISNDNLLNNSACPDKGLNYDARELLHLYSRSNTQFDLIDLDPYNSPKDCIFEAIKLANKGLIVTVGELKSLWKNFTISEKRYLFRKFYELNFKSFSDLTIDNIADSIINLSNNRLEVWKIGDWQYCDRIYFKIVK